VSHSVQSVNVLSPAAAASAHLGALSVTWHWSLVSDVALCDLLPPPAPTWEPCQ